MRKRKRQTAIFLILSILLALFYWNTHPLYFSPEEVFSACERGLHYPPSEEILLQFEAEGKRVLVGRQEDGLFVVPAVREGPFWRMPSGMIDGFFSSKEPVAGYMTYGGYYLGLCTEENITTVSIIAENTEEKQWREYSGIVEDGIFLIETDIAREKSFVAYIEGRNAAGEILYQYGDADV